MRADRPGEERLAAPERRADALPVPVPELLLGPPAPVRAPPEPREDHVQRQVEPDDRVRAAGDELTELPLVVAVDHPGFGLGRLADPAPEVLELRLGPVRPVVE